MRKYKEVIAVAIVLLVVALSFGSWALGQALGNSNIDLKSTGPVQFAFPETYQSRDFEIAPMQDETIYSVYSFAMQDLNTNATILFVTNNNVIKHEELSIFRYNLKNNIIESDEFKLTLGPANMAIICSDEVTSTVGMWRYATHWDLEPTVMYGIIFLPPGVTVNGYVAWNGSDNKYNPGTHNDNVAIVPLQFKFVGTATKVQ